MSEKHPLRSLQPGEHAGSGPVADATRAVTCIPHRISSGDRYDLEQLFLEWAWSTRCPGGWDGAVRVLARTLRGLEGAGLIERRTVRRAGHPTHHGFVPDGTRP